jgi:hypothetical protein
MTYYIQSVSQESKNLFTQTERSQQEYEYITPKTEWKLPTFKNNFLIFSTPFKIYTYTDSDWLARKLYTQILCSITLAGDSEKYRRSFPQYSERCPF